MGSRKTHLSLIVAGMVLAAGSPSARGVYLALEHDLRDGTPDTTYVGGEFSINSPADLNNQVYLYDASALSGTVSNAAVTLSTTFDSYDPVTEKATFMGGSLMLTFDYEGTSGYAFGGPIVRMEMIMEMFTPSFWAVSGEGLFQASTVNLPGSNDWPAPGFSRIDALWTQLAGVDLSGFAWPTGTFTHGESAFDAVPYPEPSTWLLLGLGSLVFARRRASSARWCSANRCAIVLLVCTMLSSNLKALDFRPQDGPLDESCAAKPADDLIAKIDKAVDAKPTATVIAPNYIVTAGHWTGLINLHVDIEVDGQIQTYKTVDGDRIDTATRDLGVYRIERCIGTGQEPCDVTEDANLEQWIDFYFAEDQVGKEFVIGSYGPQPQAGLGPGTLHWGANMVTIIEMGNPFIRFVFEETTDDDYVKYEAEGVDKDSGSGWFVRLGPEWKQAALGQTSHAGHRFSWYTAPIELYTLIDWVDDMICSLNAARPPGDQEADPRPRYDPTDTAWEGGVSSAWGTLGNWSDGVPTSSDIVRVDSIVTAVISSETAEAKELAVGYGYGYDPSVDDDCDDLTDPVPPAVT